MPVHYLRRGRGKRARPKTSGRASEPPASDLSPPDSEMADNDESPQRHGSRSMAVPASDWLRKPSPASKAAHKQFLDNTKHDGFLDLARAIRHKEIAERHPGWDKVPVQEHMLTRFYLFMRDCIPGGLTGQYSHISGGDVMEHLLCHKGETAPSRHKLSKQATEAFLRLDGWVAKGKSWREALDNHSAEGEKEMGRKKHVPKAMGLHTPAGMLALLVIAHPDDTKFKNIIVRLEIEWMFTQDRETLDVREGFWKGVTASNLYKVFSREEERDAEVEPLADCDALFRDFVRAQKDITPYLQDWARGIVRSRSTSRAQIASVNGARHARRGRKGLDDDEGDIDDNKTSGHTISAQDIALFRKHWNSPAPTSQVETEQESQHLAGWLAERLASADGQGKLLHKWCTHWRERLDASRNFRDQLIIQSLFQQSARRLYRLHEISAEIPSIQLMAASQHHKNQSFQAPLDILYMVTDIQDVELWPPLDAALAESTASFLKALPVYQPLGEATRHLKQLVESTSPNGLAVREMAEKVIQGQMSRLYDTTTVSFQDYFHGVMAFEALRTLSLLDALEDELVSDEKTRWWRAKRSLLFRPEVTGALRLTAWQLRALLLPGADCGHVLTYWQELVFISSFCDSESKGMTTFRFEDVKTMPISHDHLAKSTSNTMVWDKLLPLFGKIQHPESMPSAPEDQIPEPTTLENAPLRPSTPTAAAAASEPPEPVPSGSGMSTLLPTSASTTSVSVAYKPPPGPPGHSGARASSSQMTPVDTKVSDLPIVKNAFSPAVPQTPNSNVSITPGISVSRNAFTPIPSAPRPGHGTPAGSTSPASSMSAQPTTLTAAMGGFYAPAPTPAKRHGSPLEPAQSKLPRVGLRAELDDLSQGLSREQSDREQLGLEIKTSQEQLRTQLGGFKAELKKVTLELETIRSTLASTRSDLGKSLGESETKIQELSRALESNEERQCRMVREKFTAIEVRLGKLETGKGEEMLAEVKDIKSLLTKTPSGSEDDGHLVRQCPAPYGESQRAYESRLFQASLFYVTLMWDPGSKYGDGVGQDHLALDETKRRFPDLDEGPIVEAIRYFHTLVFNQPLGGNAEVAMPDIVEGGQCQAKKRGKG